MCSGKDVGLAKHLSNAEFAGHRCSIVTGNIPMDCNEELEPDKWRRFEPKRPRLGGVVDDGACETGFGQELNNDVDRNRVSSRNPGMR